MSTEKNGLPRQHRLCFTEPLFETLREKLENAAYEIQQVHVIARFIRLRADGKDVFIPCLDPCVVDARSELEAQLIPEQTDSLLRILRSQDANAWSKVTEEAVEGTRKRSRDESKGESWTIYIPGSLVHLKLKVSDNEPEPLPNSRVFTFHKGELYWRIEISDTSAQLTISPSLLTSQVGRMKAGQSHGVSLVLRDLLRNSVAVASALGESSISSTTPFFPGFFDFASTVRDHYDHKARTQISQQQSKAGNIRQFNNLVKSAMIEKLLPSVIQPGASGGLIVLDLACGHGQDLWKYANKGVALYVGIDISAEAIDEGRSRYAATRRKLGYEAVFLVGNLTESDAYEQARKIATEWRVKNGTENQKRVDSPFDIVAVQFCLHYLVTGPESSDFFLSQISSLLSPGGLFLGTLPCSDKFAARMVRASTPQGAPDEKQSMVSFGNSLYRVSLKSESIDDLIFGGAHGHGNVAQLIESLNGLEPKELARQLDHLWGLEYTFWLVDTISDQAEFLVPFKSLESQAAGFGLKPLLRANFETILGKFAADAKAVVEWKSKNPGKELNDEEKEVFSFYRGFALRKEQVIPSPV